MEVATGGLDALVAVIPLHLIIDRDPSFHVGPGRGNPIELVDSATIDDREYGSTEPLPIGRTGRFATLRYNRGSARRSATSTSFSDKSERAYLDRMPLLVPMLLCLEHWLSSRRLPT
jgi:hypothetical protein